MKLLIVLSVVTMAVAVPAPQLQANRYSNNNPDIIRYENNNNGLGNYRYYYEQTDGTKQEQQGELRNEGRDDQYLAVKGYYGWIGPDGVTYLVKYTADENGYKPEIEEGPGGAVPDSVIASLLG